MTMASSPSQTSNSNRRSRRETVEEELWMLRSRNFVKPESHRLNNSLSPRFSRIKGDGSNVKTTRRWRRKVLRSDDDDENHHNLVNRVRASAARSARVLQLRIAGKRGWWPSKHRPTSTARIAAVEGCPMQHGGDGGELQLKFDKIRKKHSESAMEDQDDATQESKVERDISCEDQNINCNEISDISAKAGLCSDVDTSNTKRVMSITGNDDSDESSVTDYDDNGDTKEEENRKKRQNIVVAAVATTSVSSLGVALAFILL